MIIRKATQKDLNILNKLQIGLAKYERKICKTLKNPDSIRKEFYEYYKKKIRQKNCVFFVAEESKKIIGYVLGEIEKPTHHHIYKYRGYINDVFVLEGYRERGIGEELTKKLIEFFESKGIKWIRVSAYVKNKSAIKFWKKMGFKDYVIDMAKIAK
jgi:ribosomal protein S18 acetylase RimI-like enzyme